MKVTPKSKGETQQKITFKTKDTPNLQMLQWWVEKNSDKAAAQVLTTAAFLKEGQQFRQREAAIFARLYGNKNLYGFAGANMSKMSNNNELPVGRPTYNLVSSITDTLVARIAQSKPQPRFLTDYSDYKQRTLAKKLDNFISGEFYRVKAYELGTAALRDAGVLGDGLLHPYEGPDKKVAVERVLATELYTDVSESMYGKPRQLYRLKLVDREVLKANFPKFKAKLDLAAKATVEESSADNSKAVSDLVMVVEAWRLPSGVGTGDGRHMLACSTCSLLDEEWTKDYFPFVKLPYAPRLLGYWAQGIAERQMGTQMELNSILYTISQAIKLVGVPRVFQEDGSKVVAASHNNEIGVIVKYRGTKPSYEVAPCNAPELYAERDKLITYAYQSEGVSQLQASSQKPAGLNSGEAIRSYEDIANDRFAILEKRYSDFYVELAYKMLDLAKDIAKRDGSYSTVYPNKNGIKEINLPKAEMLLENTYVIQCLTQSSLPKEPAGRLQRVVEMIQSGMITIQEGRRLLDFPDLGQEEQLANAAEERIFQILDDIIESGKYIPPEPTMDLQLADQRTVQYINLYSQAKLEESKLQMLRNFRAQIQVLVQQAMPPQPALPPPTPQALPEPLPTNPMIPNAPGAAPAIPPQ